MEGTDAALLKSVRNEGVDPVLPKLDGLVLVDAIDGVSLYS